MKMRVVGLLGQDAEVRQYAARGADVRVQLLIGADAGGLPLEVQFRAGTDPDAFLAASERARRAKRGTSVVVEGTSVDFIADHGVTRVVLRGVENLVVGGEVWR